MSLINIEKLVMDNILKYPKYIDQVETQINKSYHKPLKAAPFIEIIKCSHNHEILELSFAFYCLTNKNILVIQKGIPINNTNIYLPLFHLPTRYLRTITIKTVHDETRQKTTFIPCIDTNLLEGMEQ